MENREEPLFEDVDDEDLTNEEFKIKYDDLDIDEDDDSADTL